MYKQFYVIIYICLIKHVILCKKYIYIALGILSLLTENVCFCTLLRACVACSVLCVCVCNVHPYMYSS